MSRPDAASGDFALHKRSGCIVVDAVSAARQLFFLHGGPGFSATLERSQYGDALPIHWWDQPKIAMSAPCAFEQLVAACEQELARLAFRKNGPLPLLASSFGARIALELLRRSPHNVDSVTVSGGVLDLRQAFVRFGRRLARTRGMPQLNRLAAEAERFELSDALWPLIEAIASTPDFLDAYWSPAATVPRDAMRALAAAGPLFDMETFRVVTNDVLQIPLAPAARRHDDRIRILIGRHDPYADVQDAEHWQHYFPGARIEHVEAGHFPHLELPPSEWMPESALPRHRESALGGTR